MAVTNKQQTIPQNDEKLGRFGHHPDPALDFCVEVEKIKGEWLNIRIGFESGTPAMVELRQRIEKAIQFRVGGDLNAVEAKRLLRRIDAEMQSLSARTSESTIELQPEETETKIVAAYEKRIAELEASLEGQQPMAVTVEEVRHLSEYMDTQYPSQGQWRRAREATRKLQSAMVAAAHAPQAASSRTRLASIRIGLMDLSSGLKTRGDYGLAEYIDREIAKVVRILNETPSPAETSDDWTVSDTETAGEILNYLGIGHDASKEPGADRRRDIIARIIRARVDAAPAPMQHARFVEFLRKVDRPLLQQESYQGLREEARTLIAELKMLADVPSSPNIDVQSLVDQSVRQEREGCAFAVECHSGFGDPATIEACAALVRARGEEEEDCIHLTKPRYAEIMASLAELVDAMKRYEMDVDSSPPHRHRDMMDRATWLIDNTVAPSPLGHYIPEAEVSSSRPEVEV